jgi:hypothetical protein|tara:strand:- start:71 stop:316 length:246 start_codon:yes stop_codon:yes gene_type:complete
MRLRENFLELCIEEVYILITEDDHWPANFTNDMKLELLTRIQKYYEKQDTVTAYKKCAKLQNHIDIYQYEISGSYVDKIFN